MVEEGRQERGVRKGGRTKEAREVTIQTIWIKISKAGR
jgi:hypothetical protein